jgi:hypothetical protein
MMPPSVPPITARNTPTELRKRAIMMIYAAAKATGKENLVPGEIAVGLAFPHQFFTGMYATRASILSTSR